MIPDRASLTSFLAFPFRPIRYGNPCRVELVSGNRSEGLPHTFTHKSKNIHKSTSYKNVDAIEFSIKVHVNQRLNVKFSTILKNAATDV